MMLEQKSFQLSDSNYHDSIKTHPAHYYSMRAKPTNPVALIEQNISSIRTYPYMNNYTQTGNEWKYFRHDKQFNKRCVFNYDPHNLKIHLASLDSISNQHLLDPTLRLPHEDDVYRNIGQKRNMNKIDKRNGLSMLSKGDKTYKAAEYSKEFFSKKNRNWRTEYFGLTKRSEEPLPDELMELLSTTQRNTLSSIFSNKFDYGYEHDPKMEQIDDINSVKSLNTWKTSTPLTKPFKVLDVTDKLQKYRPRITR